MQSSLNPNYTPNCIAYTAYTTWQEPEGEGAWQIHDSPDIIT